MTFKVEYARHKIYFERTKFLILKWKLLHNYESKVDCSINENSPQVENIQINPYSPQTSAHRL